MSDETRIGPVHCNNCGAVLNESPHAPVEDRKPCPSCGSMAWLFEVTASASVEVHAKVNLKARHGQPGKVTPFRELTSGDDFYRKAGEWRDREYIIDHEKNEYHERIIDPKTGKDVHECHEPLDQHQGRGKAKR